MEGMEKDGEGILRNDFISIKGTSGNTIIRAVNAFDFHTRDHKIILQFCSVNCLWDDYEIADKLHKYLRSCSESQRKRITVSNIHGKTSRVMLYIFPSSLHYLSLNTQYCPTHG